MSIGIPSESSAELPLSPGGISAGQGFAGAINNMNRVRERLQSEVTSDVRSENSETSAINNPRKIGEWTRGKIIATVGISVIVGSIVLFDVASLPTIRGLAEHEEKDHENANTREKIIADVREKLPALAQKVDQVVAVGDAESLDDIVREITIEIARLKHIGWPHGEEYIETGEVLALAGRAFSRSAPQAALERFDEALGIMERKLSNASRLSSVERKTLEQLQVQWMAERDHIVDLHRRVLSASPTTYANQKNEPVRQR